MTKRVKGALADKAAAATFALENEGAVAVFDEAAKGAELGMHEARR